MGITDWKNIIITARKYGSYRKLLYKKITRKFIYEVTKELESNLVCLYKNTKKKSNEPM